MDSNGICERVLNWLLIITAGMGFEQIPSNAGFRNLGAAELSRLGADDPSRERGQWIDLAISIVRETGSPFRGDYGGVSRRNSESQ